MKRACPLTSLLVIVAILPSLPMFGQEAVTVFQGIPSIKISEGGDERVPENLTRDKAVNLACVISRIGEKYYWASRENKLMRRVQSGAFTTFFAEDGSGYVRVVSNPSDQKLFKFGYVEHLLTMLNSITYYG